MTGTARGGGEAETHALHDARVVAGRLHALDVHGDAFEAVLLLDPQDAVCPDVADALAQAHLGEEVADAVGVAELHLLVDEAALRGLDGQRAEVAGGHAVDAEAVADVVEPHDLARSP